MSTFTLEKFRELKQRQEAKEAQKQQEREALEREQKSHRVRTCKRPGCGKTFLAHRKDQLFCLPGCRVRHWQETNEDYKERQRAAAKVRYATRKMWE